MDDKIEQLAEDFANENGPFATANFPEAKLYDHFGEQYKAEYLTLFCTLDYNRRVDGLVENIIELHDRNGDKIFTPPLVMSMNVDEMQEEFKDIGFRYGGQDAEVWHHNCEALNTYVGSSWADLHAASGYHATTLVKVIRDYGFKYLQGKKLAPFYCRVVHDFVHPLRDIWQLDVPVDTHIRKLTQELAQQDMSDDEIREYWRKMGEELNISPHIVDGGLWMIGYSWNDWGQKYFEELTGRETFKYL